MTTTYCPFGQKCVGMTGCAPAASSEPGSISSSPVSDRSSASLQSGSVTGVPTSSSYDYGLVISEYISVVTELSQLIVTSTASNGSTAVTTEQVPVHRHYHCLREHHGQCVCAGHSDADDLVGCWSGAAMGVTVTVIAIAITSAIFKLQ